MNGFLPISKEDMMAEHIEQLDFVYIVGGMLMSIILRLDMQLLVEFYKRTDIALEL